MSFREKTAWAMSFILFMAGAWYFTKIVNASNALGQTSPPDLRFFIGYVALVVITSIIVSIILAATSGKEANAPADERETAILHKAGHWSGYILALGAFTGLWHFGWLGDGNLLFHIIFGALMLSQIAEYVFHIFLYRRGV